MTLPSNRNIKNRLVMKYFAIIFISAFLFAPNTYAQDAGNTITVIREDGTQESIDVAPSASAPAPQEEPVSAAPEPDAEYVEPAQSPVFQQQAVEPEAPVEAAPQVVEEQAPEPVLEPEPQPEAVPKPKAKKPAPPPQQTKEAEPVAKPKKKPEQKEYVRPSEPISESLALSLAIDEAPPADDFQMYKSYQGQTPIYQVLFRAGGRFYEVQIDAFEGIILYSAYRDDLTQITPKAGHLPNKWSPSP